MAADNLALAMRGNRRAIGRRITLMMDNICRDYRHAVKNGGVNSGFYDCPSHRRGARRDGNRLLAHRAWIACRPRRLNGGRRLWEMAANAAASLP